MRKIEQEMLEALSAKKAWSKSNMQVSQVDETSHIYLHGNLIAILRGAGKHLTIWHCAYKTPLTKSGLNVLLSEYASAYRIFQKDSIWYIGLSHEKKPLRSFVYPLSFRQGTLISLEELPND